MTLFLLVLLVFLLAIIALRVLGSGADASKGRARMRPYTHLHCRKCGYTKVYKGC